MNFPNNLRRLMNIKGLVGKELAEKMGVSTSTVIHWANGTRFPKKEDTFLELADIFNVTIIDLLGEYEPQKQKIIKKELQFPSAETKEILLEVCKKNNTNNFLSNYNSGNINSSINNIQGDNNVSNTNPVLEQKNEMLSIIISRITEYFEKADLDSRDDMYFKIKQDYSLK